MSERKEKLAKFLERSREKTAARGGRKRSRQRVDKDRLKCLEKFHDSKKRLSKLRDDKKKLDEQLAATEQDMQSCRADMLQLTDVLRNMELLDCNYVMMYNNSDDVGYIVDKDEHHLEVDDSGDISLTLMKEYKRQQRQEAREQNQDYGDYADDDDEDLDDVNDAHDDMSGSVGGMIPGIDRLSDPQSPRTEEEHEEKYEEGIYYPNFRFGE